MLIVNMFYGLHFLMLVNFSSSKMIMIFTNVGAFIRINIVVKQKHNQELVFHLKNRRTGINGTVLNICILYHQEIHLPVKAFGL